MYIGCETPYVEFISSESDFRYSYVIPSSEPDLEKLRRESGMGSALIGKNVIDICLASDVVFIALHGSSGENGQLQAVFDSYGIKYTGSGYIGCLLAMDKDISKKLMVQDNIKTARWNTYNLAGENPPDFSDVKYPCVVKPCSCGSSVGISIINDHNELNAAINAVRIYEDTVLIEDKINGREFSIGVLGGKALPPIEIIPKSGFYDYKNKYQSEMTHEICPADITPEVDSLLRESALRVHKALRLGYYSRIDFILDSEGTPWCLEANTLPGMTPTSLLPQEAKAEGIAYKELCECIVTHTV